MSRREQIKMSEARGGRVPRRGAHGDVRDDGPRGWPHLMPLWYVLRDAPPGEPGPRLWAWTYAASQKVRNLERDPRATLQVEAGEQYQELRGVMLECEVVVHRDLEIVSALGQEIFARYATPARRAGGRELPREVRRDGRQAGRQARRARVRRAAARELGSPQARRRSTEPRLSLA